MQTAGNLIGTAAKLSAGMQHGQNNLKRRQVRIFRVRVNRNAAAVVGNGNGTVGIHTDFDTVGKTGDCLVHRVVQNFGNQMVQRRSIRATDVHARTGADRLQTFQNLNILRRIGLLLRRRAIK